MDNGTDNVHIFIVIFAISQNARGQLQTICKAIAFHFLYIKVSFPTTVPWRPTRHKGHREIFQNTTRAWKQLSS